MNMLLLKGKY